MKERFIKRCENCPERGAHVHYDGKIENIPDELSGIYVATFNGIISRVRKKNKK